MDKEKFRELLQIFEQLSVKPEPDSEGDSRSASAVSSEFDNEIYLAGQCCEPSGEDLDHFLMHIESINVSFPELESTNPPLNRNVFRESELLSSSATNGCKQLCLELQEQLRVASRFRLAASLTAQLWLIAHGSTKGSGSAKGAITTSTLSKIETGLEALCSATLLEADQIERRVEERHLHSGWTNNQTQSSPRLLATPPYCARQNSDSTSHCDQQKSNIQLNNEYRGSCEGFRLHPHPQQQLQSPPSSDSQPCLHTSQHIESLQQQQQQQQQHLDHNKKSVSYTPALVSSNDTHDSNDIPLGGRLCEFSDAWCEITDDTWVLSTVKDGLKLQFSAHPEYPDIPEGVYSKEEQEVITNLIRWDLGDKAIEEIEYSPDLFVSQMYTIKVAGKFKPLMECRPINKFLEMNEPTVHSTAPLGSLLSKNSYMTRINIKCAYISVPIHPDHRRYLAFKFEGKYYQYCTLPFGISVASRVFTKLLQTALEYLIDRGYRLTFHIDEIVLLHELPDVLSEQTKVLCNHLIDLGFDIHLDKSDLVPQQNQRFLSFIFNTTNMTIQTSRDQIKKVRRAAHTARASNITVKQLASLIGKIRSIMPAIGPYSYHIQHIQKSLDESVTTPESWDNRIQLPPEAIAEIDWLCEHILSQKTLPIGFMEKIGSDK